MPVELKPSTDKVAFFTVLIIFNLFTTSLGTKVFRDPVSNNALHCMNLLPCTTFIIAVGKILPLDVALALMAVSALSIDK